MLRKRIDTAHGKVSLLNQHKVRFQHGAPFSNVLSPRGCIERKNAEGTTHLTVRAITNDISNCTNSSKILIA